MFLESLRTIDVELAKLLNLVPGQKLCPTCDKTVKQEVNPSSTDEDFEPRETSINALNSSATMLGCSPIKVKKLGNRDKVGYGKRKLHQVKKASKEKMAKILSLPGAELQSTDEEASCSQCQDFERLIFLLKEKCNTASRQQKIKILTLIPESWSIEKTAQEFNVTKHVVRRAHELKKQKGILSDPNPKKGKLLDADITEQVISFYQLDEYSRICPGKKEFVSVSFEGGRIHKQKRLLLLNLKELHQQFLQSTGKSIGFSKFCELRPKWCVTVNSKGMHSVCVCEKHQNAKLFCSALPGKYTYQDVLLFMVCSLENRNCMMHLCNKCRGSEVFKKNLEQIFEEHDLDLDDVFIVKQWMHTDRTKLMDLQFSVSEFIETICEKLNALQQHHFISKSQSAFLNACKAELRADEVIILLDFAENFSFLVQDAVLGFHWENSQATLHPFTVYYKDGNEICNLSISIISDTMQHDCNTVHAFIVKALEYLKQKLPAVTKVIYFSDGAASQYKNFKNLINLCHHTKDHNLQAQWHFFATSHGKSPCDGLGGTTKRLVARASLQAPEHDQILTPLQMFTWADQHITGIKYIYVSESEVLCNLSRFDLQSRYAKCKTIPGTRSHHSFKPISDNIVEMRRLSFDVEGRKVLIGCGDTLQSKSLHTNLTLFQPGKYVACLYNQQWHIGVIHERCEEENDVYVKFMKKSSGEVLSWPQNVTDECWIPFQDILCIVEAPKPQGHSVQNYKLLSSDMDLIRSIFHGQ